MVVQPEEEAEGGGRVGRGMSWGMAQDRLLVEE